MKQLPAMKRTTGEESSRILLAPYRFLVRSDHIQPSLGRSGPITLLTDTSHDQGVTALLEKVAGTHFPNGILDRLGLEFDHFAAHFANEVFVLRITVIVFVNRAGVDLDATEETGVDQFRQGPIDRGPADAKISPIQVTDQLVDIEMIVLGENKLDEFTLGPSQSLRFRPRRQVLAEFALRRLRDGDGRQHHNQLPQTVSRSASLGGMMRHPPQ